MAISTVFKFKEIWKNQLKSKSERFALWTFSKLYFHAHNQLRLIHIRKGFFMQGLWMSYWVNFCSGFFVASIIYHAMPNINVVMIFCELDSFLYQKVHFSKKIWVIRSLVFDKVGKTFLDRTLRILAFLFTGLWMIVMIFSGAFEF